MKGRDQRVALYFRNGAWSRVPSHVLLINNSLIAVPFLVLIQLFINNICLIILMH